MLYLRHFKNISLILGLNFAQIAWAWGERGHDATTRIAVRSLKSHRHDSLYQLLLQKEHLLAHLSNVPDIVWRNLDPKTEQLNGPTHYLDLEFLGPPNSLEKTPQSYDEQLRLIKKLCMDPISTSKCPATLLENKPPSSGSKNSTALATNLSGPSSPDPELLQKLKASDAGTAPFRIQQLFRLTKGAFEDAHKALKKSPPNQQVYITSLNKALEYAGILSHFVGDLANPWHTTYDYDGYGTNQGGVHHYFETNIVDELDLALEIDSLSYLQKNPPLKKLTQKFPIDQESLKQKPNATWPQDPLLIAYALTLDSFESLSKVKALDLKYAVLSPSSRENGLKVPARRQPAHKVTQNFRGIIIERLSLAAEITAHLWVLAYEQGGKPDLIPFKSYHYPVAPGFIAPDGFSG